MSNKSRGKNSILWKSCKVLQNEPWFWEKSTVPKDDTEQFSNVLIHGKYLPQHSWPKSRRSGVRVLHWRNSLLIFQQGFRLYLSLILYFCLMCNTVKLVICYMLYATTQSVLPTQRTNHKIVLLLTVLTTKTVKNGCATVISYTYLHGLWSGAAVWEVWRNFCWQHWTQLKQFP